MFGSIREVVELSNALVERGHSVTIHHRAGTPCAWLPCYADVMGLDGFAEYDLLLLVTEWKWDDYQLLLDCKAKLRGVVMMGFTPSDDLEKTLQGWPYSPKNGEKVIAAALYNPDVIVFADGPWQLAWIHERFDSEIGVALGGVNTGMFCPKRADKIRLGSSGDPRERKGSDAVNRAIEIIQGEHEIEARTYWGKRYTQQELVAWYQDTTIFLDGHSRGGWCNPVFEAMACGCAVVCTDIPAVTPLAIHGSTARVVPVGDAEAMAREACWLLDNRREIEAQRERAIAMARAWDYRVVAERLETYLEERLGKHSMLWQERSMIAFRKEGK